MKIIKFLNWKLKPIQCDFVGLDDIVCVNGIVGWLSFYGRDYIVVITENEVHCKILIKDIHSFHKLSTFIEGNMTNISIRELLEVQDC